MRVFVFGIIKFLGILLITAIFLVGAEIYIVKNQGIKISSKKNILVLGDSHTECSINEAVMPRVANFSESGSTYYYSFIKLKEIVRVNKQIDTLILSFHFGSLDKDNEKEFLYNESYNFERLPKFIPFLDKEELFNYYDKIILVKSILNSPAHYFPFIISNLKGGNFQTERMKLGAFSATDRNKLNEDIEIRKSEGTLKLKKDFSEAELKLLKQIKLFCNENNICLILLNTPVYNAEQYTDVSFYNKFKADNENDFHFLDLNQFNPGAEGFGDISHLNKSGALLFSNELNRVFSLNTLHKF